MTGTSLVGRGAALLAGVAGLTVSLAAAPAHAQVRVMASITEDGGGGGFGASQIAKKNVDAYAKLLGLTDEQKETVSALHEGYQAQFQEASGEMRAVMEEARRSFEESQDPAAFAEKMPAARKKYRDRTRELEKTFMADLKSVLTPEQTAQWPRVERQRRRETTLRMGSLSGETVNLIEIVEGLSLAEAGRAALAQALEEYETDLDRALAAKEKQMEDGPAFESGRPFDVAAMQERMAKAREAGAKVRDVNQRHARKLESLLPEDTRPAFDGAVRRASFPRVYRPSRVSRSLDAAEKFDDLDASQRESLSSIRAAYERDLAQVNDRWASAIEEDEKAPNGGEGGMSFGGDGQNVQISFGDEEQTGPLAEARKARRELDDRTRERIESLLTKAQRDRLPRGERGDGQGQVETMDQAVIIRGGGG